MSDWALIDQVLAALAVSWLFLDIGETWMHRLFLVAFFVFGSFAGAHAQTAAYGDGGEVIGLDGIELDGNNYGVRFYDASVADLIEHGALPADQVLLIGSNDAAYRQSVEALQAKLADIASIYGSYWIPGCGSACLIKASVGYHAQSGLVMQSSVRHGPVATVVAQTGTLLSATTVGMDHTMAVWQLEAKQ